MNLQLRKVKIYPKISGNSLAYHGELWIDDQLVADLANLGDGHPDIITSRLAAWNRLPPDELMASARRLAHPLSLRSWISREVNKSIKIDETL